MSVAFEPRTKTSELRSTLLLKAPARPRSAVMMTIWRRGPSRCSSSGCAEPSPSSAADTRLPSSSAILFAYGRAARIRSCARRSLAAATSFMARVIFCVDWTDRIRRWMSRSVAMTLRGLDALGGDELGLGVGDGLAELLPEAVADLLLVADLGQDLRLPPLQPAVEEFLERPHGVHRQIVEQSLRAGEDDGHLLLDRQRLVLALLEELDHALAAGQLVLGGLVEVRPELREGRQLAVLREVEPQLAGHLAHGLDLGRAADARDREADVHGRPDAAVEEVGLQIDLAVGDRDHVGGDVGRHVAELGLDDRQRG